MPIQFNGTILSSKNKNLEFIADEKYPTYTFTKNKIEYDADKWTIQTFSILGMETLKCILIVFS